MDVGSPFGSRTRTRVLLALELHGQSYPREIARRLAAPISVVQKAVRSLEKDTLITGRMLGRTRLLELNPGYFAFAQLRGFLARLARTDDGLELRAEGGRRRSRRTRRSAVQPPSIAAQKGPRREARAEDGGHPDRADRWRVW